jgi:hypothetical protein
MSVITGDMRVELCKVHYSDMIYCSRSVYIVLKYPMPVFVINIFM